MRFLATIILPLLLCPLLQAQIEYSASSTQATLFLPPNAIDRCEVRASLSADMRDPVLARQSDLDPSRFLLEDLQPNQRYIVQLDCDGTFIDAVIVFTEPEVATKSEPPVPDTLCDVSSRQVETGETGGILALPLNPECGESLAADSSWLRFHPHSTQAQLFIEPNPGAARRATLSVGGESVVVRQSGTTGCSFSLGSSWYPGNAATYAMTVPAPPGCAWSVVSAPPWVTITGTPTGSGPGQFTYSVGVNGSTLRSGAITLSGGQTFQLNQLPGSCGGTGGGSSWFPTTGGTYSFPVAAPAGCPWTISVSAAWIHVTSPLSGHGPATIAYTIDPNVGFARTATITVAFAGGTITFTARQPNYVHSGTCTYSLTNSSLTVGPESQSVPLSVTTQPGCTWTYASNSIWAIAVNSGNTFIGPGSATLSVGANTSAATRTAIVTIGGISVTINQLGLPCKATFGTPGSYFPAGSGTYSLWISAPDGCSWTASVSSPFLHLPAPGPIVGSGMLTFSVDANTGPYRTGTVSIGESLYLVSQIGSPCAATLPALSSWFPGTAGTYSITISVPPGCPWMLGTNVSWIQTGFAAGSGPAVVTYSLLANPTPSVRVGRLILGSSSMTVNQVPNY
jgi:hypothetical protein